MPRPPLNVAMIGVPAGAALTLKLTQTRYHNLEKQP